FQLLTHIVLSVRKRTTVTFVTQNLVFYLSETLVKFHHVGRPAALFQHLYRESCEELLRVSD
ncbi:hypothetical protein PO909_016163, partial [Leuciscus waleckii]